jgi:hypothetical protein
MNMSVDDAIAFAASVQQSVLIQDSHNTTIVSDQAGLLQAFCGQRHAAPGHTQHLGYEFLCEGKTIAAEKIAGLQQPAAQPRLQFVQGVAGRLAGNAPSSSVRAPLTPL